MTWHSLIVSWMYILHPYAKVLATFAFYSYSQSKRSPRPPSRHRPCKTPFPIGNATFNKLPRFYLKWVFLINSQWNAGFIQPFLPRTAESASSPSIVATATAEPGSPTNFAPISFSAWKIIYPSGPKMPMHNVGAAKPNSQRCQSYRDNNPKHNLNAASPL